MGTISKSTKGYGKKGKKSLIDSAVLIFISLLRAWNVMLWKHVLLWNVMEECYVVETWNVMFSCMLF